MILRQEWERCNGRDGDTSMTQEEMRQILEIGVSLSMEKDFNKLLETILEQVMELSRSLRRLLGHDLDSYVLRAGRARDLILS